jgi:hypothetical protein
MANLDEYQTWAEQQAADPCAAFGHACRCPSPTIDALINRLNTEHHGQAEKFTALFTRPSSPAQRTRLAELDALTDRIDRIDPLIEHLSTTWRNVEHELGWRRS